MRRSEKKRILAFVFVPMMIQRKAELHNNENASTKLKMILVNQKFKKIMELCSGFVE